MGADLGTACDALVDAQRKLDAKLLGNGLPLEHEGAADFILANDRMGQAGFLRAIIADLSTEKESVTGVRILHRMSPELNTFSRLKD